MKVAGWCEAHYVDLMPHNPFGPICTAACIHVGAAVPNFCAMECFQDRVIHSNIFPQHHLREGGASTDGSGGTYCPTPTTVGLGVDVNEAELMKLEYLFRKLHDNPPQHYTGDLVPLISSGAGTNRGRATSSCGGAMAPSLTGRDLDRMADANW